MSADMDKSLKSLKCFELRGMKITPFIMAGRLSFLRVGNAQLPLDKRFIDSLPFFGIGASWGGYECLALTYPPDRLKGWNGGALIRMHIGLEDPADVIADLQRGFDTIRGK